MQMRECGVKFLCICVAKVNCPKMIKLLIKDLLINAEGVVLTKIDDSDCACS